MEFWSREIRFVSTKIYSIAGVSASGKSLLAKTLREVILEKLPHLSINLLEEDSYYRDQTNVGFNQRQNTNYDHPSTIDHDLLMEHLRLIKSGLSVNIPVYDYHKHNRAKSTREIQPTDLLIMSGALLLYKNQFDPYTDFTIFIDCPLDLCFSRRIVRDVAERGRTADFAKEQYRRDVLPMYYKYVNQTRSYADLIVKGEQNVSRLANQITSVLLSQDLLPGINKK